MPNPNDIRSFFKVLKSPKADAPPSEPDSPKIYDKNNRVKITLVEKKSPNSKKRKVSPKSEEKKASTMLELTPKHKKMKLVCRSPGVPLTVEVDGNIIPTIKKSTLDFEIKAHNDVEFGKSLRALNKSGTIMLYDDSEDEEEQSKSKSKPAASSKVETKSDLIGKESKPTSTKLPLHTVTSATETSSMDKQKKEVQVESPKKSQPIVIDPDYKVPNAWVDKYKPTSINQIIGQFGPSSNCEKLKKWLSRWYVNQNGKTKLVKPSPWAKNDDGAYFKAALLSGPPGVGKTTTATLVCKALGMDTVEFNASDTRSKKLLQAEVSDLISNKSLSSYFASELEKVSEHHVLIMDEVDGMAGNEDRGGIQELISLIKTSNIPIICMCNDRNHPKMRSLVNYCFDLRFNKPKLEQIRGAMMSVCFKEGVKMTPSVLNEIISGTGNDIRQTLNHLCMYSASGKTAKLSDEQAKEDAQKAKKDIKIGAWDVIRKVFSAEDHKTMSIHDKSDLFFYDYSIAPLFVQENYLKVRPKDTSANIMDCVAAAADSLSFGDLVERSIRSNNSWSLLPTQAMFSSVIPGEYMSGTITKQINFPGWLGKNSRANKRKRLAQEIHDHTRLVTSGSRLSVRMDYAPYLVSAILRPLKEKGTDGVTESLNVIKEYRLLREDIESLVELTTWPKKKHLMESIDGKHKAALTRLYNKEITPYSYSNMSTIKKKKATVASDEFELDEEGNPVEPSDEEDNADENDLSNNAFVTVKKPTTSKASSSRAAPKAKKQKVK